MGAKDGYDTEWTKNVNPPRDKSGSLLKSITRRGDQNPQRAWGTEDTPKPGANAAIDKAVGPTRTGDMQAKISRRALGMEKPATSVPGPSVTPAPKPDSTKPAATKASGPPKIVPKASRPPGSASDREMGPGPKHRREAARAPAATASKQSWWDKFGSDHKLSADKSYSDYKKLMGD